MRLSDVAQVHAGIQKGADTERRRHRLRVTEGQADERYQHERRQRGREDEAAGLEHAKRTDDLQGDLGAREAARGAAAEPGELTRLPHEGTAPIPERMPDGGTQATPWVLPAAPTAAAADPASGEPRTLRSSEAAPPAPQTTALWLRQAEAQRDYWVKRGRPERATEVMKKAYTNAFAEDEARFKFDLEPRERDLRLLNLDAREMEADQKARGLRQSVIQNQLTAAGKLWGLMKIGATREALDLFNTSSMLQPGVKAESAKVMKAKDLNGQIVDVMVLFDGKGEVVKDKSGKELIYPTALLERMHKLATTSTATLKRGESLYQLQTDPGGSTTVTPVVSASDPEQTRATDSAWSTAINRNTDDASKYLKDTLGLSPNAMGQIMNPQNSPLFERALPKVTAKLQQARQGGQRIDQMDGVSIAKAALAEAREELKREAAGAGPKGSPKSKPTVKDIIGG